MPSQGMCRVCHVGSGRRLLSHWFGGLTCLLMWPGGHGWLLSFPHFFPAAPNLQDKNVCVALRWKSLLSLNQFKTFYQLNPKPKGFLCLLKGSHRGSPSLGLLGQCSLLFWVMGEALSVSHNWKHQHRSKWSDRDLKMLATNVVVC